MKHFQHKTFMLDYIGLVGLRLCVFSYQDAGQKAFGAVTCNICGMLYSPSSPEDESQHLLFHNQFISAVKYVVRQC